MVFNPFPSVSLVASYDSLIWGSNILFVPVATRVFFFFGLSSLFRVLSPYERFLRKTVKGNLSILRGMPFLFFLGGCRNGKKHPTCLVTVLTNYMESEMGKERLLLFVL